MRIETKFDVGDEVWYIRHNEIKKGSIIAIYTSFYKYSNILNISYRIPYSYGHSDYQEYREHEIFTTKEDLLKSL